MYCYGAGVLQTGTLRLLLACFLIGISWLMLSTKERRFLSHFVLYLPWKNLMFSYNVLWSLYESLLYTLYLFTELIIPPFEEERAYCFAHVGRSVCLQNLFVSDQ